MADSETKNRKKKLGFEIWNLLSRYLARTGAGARISRGKIEPPLSCEINAADHCNQSCLDCNHAAPQVKERFANPETVRRDLAILSKCYRPRLVKVLGGEPLLHPDLKSIVDAVRKSGICDNILLVTNGLSLDRMPERIWSAVDAIELSLYPGGPITKRDFRGFAAKGKEHGVAVRAFYYDRFRVTISVAGTKDANLTRRIFQTCKMGNEWGCHSIHEGYFYRCPQSIYIPRIVNDPGLSQTTDGFKIGDSDGFKQELYRFLTSRKPLKSCRYCLGHSGKLRPHKTVKRDDWISLHMEPTEQLVDFEKLKRAEQGDCAGDISRVAVDENSDLLPD